MTNYSTEIATIGGGCFWCTEAVFQQVRGVRKVESGYAGGASPNPTYEQICTGKTGHAEVVRLEFDPAVISYKELLEIFFTIHDPTTLNRQGNDIGTQYRSVVFYHTRTARNSQASHCRNGQCMGCAISHRIKSGSYVLQRRSLPSKLLSATPKRVVLCVCGGIQSG